MPQICCRIAQVGSGAAHSYPESAQLVRTGAAANAVVVRADKCGDGANVDRHGGVHVTRAPIPTGRSYSPIASGWSVVTTCTG
jgi:hypothetical protein